jgi:hypothetical protein
MKGQHHKATPPTTFSSISHLSDQKHSRTYGNAMEALTDLLDLGPH